MPERVVLFSSALPGWDAGRVIAAAAALGLPAVEWGAGPGHAIARPADGPRVAEQCARAGLRIAGLSVQDPAATLGAPRAAARYLRLADALGAPAVRLFAGAQRGGAMTPALERSRAALDALVDEAAAALLVETSPGTLAPSACLARELVAHQPPVRAGVLYDPGNTVIEGFLAPALAVALLGAHLRHVHVKNIAWARAGGGWRWRRATLDGGLVDWPATLRALGGAGYGGAFSIDHLSAAATRARLAAETGRLRELLAAAAG